ncbi:hypothetical protein ACMHYB_56605 [Sorangium sp. So ce1128]|uniref:Cytochrome c domain-containing protein n=1 Tax=Sorangium cellulosum TaxID=56 RepID=A0A3S5GY91_SORCE|nr:hypothetical protein [Sorangium cellulosum]
MRQESIRNVRGSLSKDGDDGGARASWRVAWFLLAVAGCGGSSKIAAPVTASSRPVGPPEPVATAAVSTANEDGAAVFAQRCAGCHQGPDPSRPDFSVPLTRDLASRAILAVLAQDMPPRTSTVRAGFTEAGRASLLQWLCSRTSRSEDTCARFVRFETAPVLTRSGPTILTAINQDAASPITEDTTKFVLDSSPTNPNGYTGPRQTVRDARLVGVALLAAVEACRPPSGQPATAAIESERRRCVEKILARAVEPPSPARR